MKAYPLIVLLFVCSCESTTKPAVEQKTTIVKDSTKPAQDSMQAISETSRPITYEEQLNYLRDTIRVTTKQNYYNRDYELTIHEFIEDKEKAIELLQAGKSFAPFRYKAYQIVLTLDGKPVFEKLINAHTFRDSLKNTPLEKYYLAKVEYTGVRVNRLFFTTYLRLRDRSADTLSQKLKDRSVMFEIDYLKKIGQLDYNVLNQ